jgi:hypothetical protein
MRKRVVEETATPKRCNHEEITFDGKTLAACLWGASMEFAIPLGTPEGDRMEAAESEHTHWVVTERGLALVARPELLAPDGEAWERRRGVWQTA